MHGILRGAAAIALGVAATSLSVHAQRASTDWTQWRGPTRDGVVTTFSAPATWPDALVQKWKVEVGTGYASLSYLTTLPLDALKIDRGMIVDLVDGTRDRIVVRAMIGLARELKLKVIAEGVETAGQLAVLTDWGCDLYQGFLGAEALDERELERFIAGSLADAA